MTTKLLSRAVNPGRSVEHRVATWHGRVVDAAIGWRRRTLTACGLVGTTLIAAGAFAVGPRAADFWRLPPTPLWTVVGAVATYLGIGVLVATTWLTGVLVDRAGSLDRRDLVFLALVWSLPLLVAPPLFSRDVYSYAAQARMVTLHIDPYRFGPVTIGWGPFLAAVSPVWLLTPAPYGPVFLGPAALVAGHVGGNLLAAVLGLRVIEMVGVVLIAVFVPRLADRCSTRAEGALHLALLNPLVMLHFVSGAHNDALMVGLLVAGLALAAENRPVAGLVVCALAGLVKAPAGLAALFVALDWSSSAPDRGTRLGRGALGVGVMTATALVASRITGTGWGWITTLNTPSRVYDYFSVSTGAGMLAGGLTRTLHLTGNASWLIPVARLAGLLVAGALTVAILQRRERIGSPRAVGLILLGLVVLGPAVHPWYLLWGIVVLAAAGAGWLRPLLVWISFTMPFVVLPGGSSIPRPLQPVFMVATGLVALRAWRTVAARPAQVGA